jgi:hypothetical protein
MAMSPYRFDVPTGDPTRTPRSRVGLAGITSGAASGGEGYRQSALRPGSSGFMAATFGGAPQTDYVRPPPTAETPPPAPTPPQTPAAPTLAPDTILEGGQGGEGEGLAGSAIPDSERGDLTGLIGDINGKTAGGIAGAGLGSLAFGPIGGLVGGIAGRALGSYFDGSGDSSSDAFSGNEQMGLDANAAANNENASAAASVEVADAVAEQGLAEGGRVGPGHLEYGRQMMQNKKGLAGVSSGYMGGYAGGGPVMSENDVNAALFRRAQDQTRPTPEMIQAARVANAPTEMRRGGMRFAENNAQTDAYLNARFGQDPQYRPEARYLGDPAYITGADRIENDPLHFYYQQQRMRDAVNANTQMIEGAPLGPDHRLFTPHAMRQPQFMGAYAQGGAVGMPNYAMGGVVDELAGPNPPGPDDGFAALDGGEFVVQAQQAQRPEYASVLEEINQGTYQPPGEGSMQTAGTMPAEGHGMEGDPSSLPPDMQMALGQAVTADPTLAAALTTLLGPEAVQQLMAGAGGPSGDMAVGEEAAMTQTGRPPLAGPPPPPGIAAPPGVRPPPAATPTMPPPRPAMGGLRGIAA